MHVPCRSTRPGGRWSALLGDQDRTRWDQRAVLEGLTVTAGALASGPPGRFAWQAAIAGVHAIAPSLEQTDWPRVVHLYDLLLAVWDIPVVALNRGMTSEIHRFNGHEGGSFRISLTYDEPTSTGKSSARTDTFEGRFVRLVPDREVVQEVEFETTDPAMRGVMRISYRLREDGAATVVTGLHEDMPPGLSQEQNDLGWRISMAKLARLVESGHGGTACWDDAVRSPP